MEIILIAIIVIIVFVLMGGALIVLSPVFVPLIIYSVVQNRLFKKEYKAYLQSIEGKKFFVYTSRTNSYSYIKINLLPQLPKDVEVIYLNGKDPITNLNKKYISHALYSIQDKKGFPYLLRVENGEINDKSINNVFYNTKNQNKDIQLLLNQIDHFFKTPNHSTKSQPN
ncbi:hypothetical protein [Fluviicola sp.]|uniref:hypothetical protein n=1 Tax=Fluviicola sp. TaxID=1917219 RepID=UPI00261FE058|nr:hypothetical protein [Fluviicola sp.]